MQGRRGVDKHPGQDLDRYPLRASGRQEYSRAGPLNREHLYRPSPPGKKQSPCSSRAYLQMYRERQRRRRNVSTI
jgi:hypothetical protein